MTTDLLDRQKTKSYPVLSISVEGGWTASEAAMFIQAIDDLYDVFYVLHTMQHAPYPQHKDTLELFYLNERSTEALILRRLEYASPGSFDFLGLGKVLEHVFRFIEGMIRRADESELRKLRNQEGVLKNELLQAEIDKQRIENLRALLELDETLHLRDHHDHYVLEQFRSAENTILRRIAMNQVTSVKLTEELDDQ